MVDPFRVGPVLDDPMLADPTRSELGFSDPLNAEADALGQELSAAAALEQLESLDHEVVVGALESDHGPSEPPRGAVATAGDDEEPAEGDEGGTIKRKAARGALMVGGRTLAIRVLGLVGNLFLARMLTPEQFGLIAVGTVILIFSALIGNGGFGAALVRGEDEPTRADLETMTGFQLAASMAAVALVGVIAIFAGEVALVALVMMLSVPIAAFRGPHSMVLERHLDYPPLVRAEVAEVVALQLVSVGLVFAGLGVWGVAIGIVVQAFTGALLLTLSTDVGFVVPRIHKENFKRMAPFGLRVQLMAATSIGLVQALNIVVGALGGLHALGLWSFATRLIQPAQQIFETLRHVSYPAMARLRDAGEDLTVMTADALRLIAVATGFLIVPIAASAPSLIGFAFGDIWVPSSEILTLVLLSLLISGPVTTAFLGLILTFGHAGVALRAGILQSVVWMVGTIATYSVFGVTSVGVGALLVGPALIAFYVFYAPRSTGLSFDVRPLFFPTVCAFAAVGAGRLLEDRLTTPLGLTFLISAFSAFVLFGILMWITQRSAMNRLRGIAMKTAGK